MIVSVFSISKRILLSHPTDPERRIRPDTMVARSQMAAQRCAGLVVRPVINSPDQVNHPVGPLLSVPWRISMFR